METKWYLKTCSQFNYRKEVIQRTADIVQAGNTSVCGHLCLFALKSLANGEQFQSILNHIIVDELQTLFHPIVNATKQAAEKTKKELAPMKKTLTDIDGALPAQRVVSSSSSKTSDILHLVYT